MQAWCLPTLSTGRRAWETKLLLQQEALTGGGGARPWRSGESSLLKSHLEGVGQGPAHKAESTCPTC